jgi:hypothetical protein
MDLLDERRVGIAVQDSQVEGRPRRELLPRELVDDGEPGAVERGGVVGGVCGECQQDSGSLHANPSGAVR